MRGIGRGLFNHYVAQSNIVLIAAVRDVEGAQGLLSVPRGEGTQMHVVNIDSASRTDPFAAVMELQEKRGVHHIDVVVSSAGIVRLRATEQLPLDELEEVLRSPRFVFISAAAGSLNDMPMYPYPNPSYKGSKALANVLVVKMGMENEGARAFGLEKATLTLEKSSENTAYTVSVAHL
ncbi:hypothetical protein PG997_012236 [Apiospora hydei]|uniref:Uncharacterized protein n=1 Tax=Apiospora hydei TaxID=1337664 RepID=A0ABR1V2R5_9PEZI